MNFVFLLKLDSWYEEPFYGKFTAKDMDYKHPASSVCTEHPLGILCRCGEYGSIVDKFQSYTVGTLLPVLPKLDIEPVASGSVIWIPRKTEKFRENNEPVVYYCRAVGPETTDKRDVEKRWIPVRPDVVSPKYIRPNECHLHQSHLNSQSAVTTTLTCMLPHRGRVVKRKDIRWDVGSHKTSVEMTDELETHWGRPACCSTQWAEAFTASTGCPPY